MSDPRPSDGTLRTILVVLAVVLLAPMLLMVVAFPLLGMMGYWGGMMGGYDGAHGLSPLGGLGAMLVPLVVLVGVGYLLYRGVAGSGRAAHADPALAELRQAYARGDLTDEEYETRHETLERDRDGE
ncbi:MAG: hypothetical protein ABEJ70_07215 [Halobacteriaceae archaeon]